MRASILSLTLTTALCTLTACPEPIPVENEVATIEAITSITQRDENRLAIDYDLSDDEGDDQELTVEVCEEGEAECGALFQGAGSDGVTFVPTSPAGSIQSHRFVWDVGCGRVSGGEVIGTDLEASYVVRVGVYGEEASQVVSEPFILSDLGFSETVTCPDR